MEKILNVLLKNLINHIPSMPTLFLVEKKKKKKSKKKKKVFEIKIIYMYLKFKKTRKWTMNSNSTLLNK